MNDTSELARWTQAVEELTQQVERWAAERNWTLHRTQKSLHESRLGTYVVPVLDILTPSGQIHVEPVARYVTDADGRVDLYAWPSLNRILIVRRGDQWSLKTDSGIDWPRPWGKEALFELVASLTAAA